MFKKKDLVIMLSLAFLLVAVALIFIFNRQQFKIGDVNAIIDNDSGEIFVSLPEGSSTIQDIYFNFPFKNDSVYIKRISEGSEKYKEPEEIKLKSGETFNFGNFISHSKIIIKSTTSYIEYDLWVTTGDVPIFLIETEDSIPDEPKIGCTLNILSEKELYNTSEIASEIELVDLEKDIPKDSYSLNIKENRITGDVPQVLDFETSKRFRLSALYPDSSLLRQELSWDIYESLSGENIAPESRFVELYLNGGYQGVYLLSRRVDRNMLGIANYSKDDKEHSVIYEASNNKADYSNETKGFSQVEPDYEDDGSYFEPLEELIDFITRADNESFVENVESIIDIDNLIDNHILFLLSGNTNELASNQYIYRGNEIGDKFKFCPGSYYVTGFGIDKNSTKVSFTDVSYPTRLYNRLYEDEAYREKLKERWNYLREKEVITPDVIYEIIDKKAITLEEAANRNFEKWYAANSIYNNSSFTDEVEYIKELIGDRIGWLDSYINYPHLIKIGEEFAYIDEKTSTIFCALPPESDTVQEISWYFSPGTNIYIEPVSTGKFVVPGNEYANFEKMIANGKNTDELTIFIDEPLKGEVQSGDIFVYGWALNEKIKENTGVEHIILFDGSGKNINSYLGEARIVSRKDVAEHFGNEAYLNTGFELPIDTIYLRNGLHSIYVYAFDKQGNYSVEKIDIMVDNENYKQKSYKMLRLSSGQEYDFNEFLFHGILKIETEGSEKKYDFYLTNCSIPIVVINTNNIIIPDDSKIRASMKIMFNDSDEKNFINNTVFNYYDNIGIELRGHTSMELSPKKPYSIEIRDENNEDKNVSILGMPEESDWILIAPYSDRSLMRDVLAFELSNQMGLYAPRTKFVEVFLDGIEGQTGQPGYRGLYVLTERVKRNKDRVDVKKLDSDDAGLISGGYILEMTEPSVIQPEESYFKTDRGSTLIIKYPRGSNITDKQKAWITDYINKFELVLYGDSFKDEDEGYRKYIDVDSYIDYIILGELFKNRDFFWKSTFISKDRYGKLKLGPVWDFNLTAGNIGEEADLNEPTGWKHTKTIWTERLFKDEYFVKEFIERWKELRQNVLSDENIYRLIDNNVDILSEAQIRNSEKWDIWGIYIWPNTSPHTESYEEEIEKLKDWFSDRTAWMDRNIDDLLD